MEKIFYTLLIAGIGGYIGLKLKIPAGAFVGAMLAVAVFNMYTGKGQLPTQFKLVAQIVVGGMIGLNFKMNTLSELKSLIVPGLMLFVGLTLYCLLLGFVIHKVTGLDLVTSLFSTSPGGITDMTLISDAYGADTPKVAILHLIRLVTVITILPMAIGYLSRLLSK
ncbi:MAG: AbrB family transcriptional regulator [Clostridia bacterium]|jgi:membrane AbrB-like protein|nr:AbrB family transcriptional regulator [Clostridia bacterium]